MITYSISKIRKILEKSEKLAKIEKLITQLYKIWVISKLYYFLKLNIRSWSTSLLRYS